MPKKRDIREVLMPYNSITTTADYFRAEEMQSLEFTIAMQATWKHLICSL